MKIKLFTHTDLDGVGCAILGMLAFGKENIDIEYCDYDNINRKVEDFYLNDNIEKYDKIYITDISVNEEVAKIIDMYDQDGFTSTKLLDHHATALHLNKYEWSEVSVEAYLSHNSKEETLIEKVSGSYLFFIELLEYDFWSSVSFDELEPYKEFADTIRKYDTWLWKTKYDDIAPKKLNDLFHIKGRDRFIEDVINAFVYESYYTPSNTDLLLLELEQEKIDKYVEKKNNEIIKKEIHGYKCGVVFGELYHSELGNRLAELNPELDFIVIINPAKSVSYRGIKDDINLGKDIAKIYGGGGHSKSAGSPISDEIREKFISLIFEN